ncbi:hydrolase [Novosphingobium piscinae]|uniref:Hydrolase n=1 Tax=Novosphingobium piscinae TaxID=1507448 RepID=A0A7X1FX26_9SPHN|nr:hydrolase [Novosphingobium piscinae]MBC2667907.1 hydrolase [Novosphingobium piscinae]
MSLRPGEDAALATLAGQGEALLARAIALAEVNSGSRNLPGLAQVAGSLAALFGSLGVVTLRDPAAVTTVTPAGETVPLALGRNLHLTVRPEAPVRVLLTGHMDTVFGADDPFQACRRIDAQTVNGPGLADMKGGLVVMHAALTALEASPFAARIGYEVVINSDEEISSPGSAPLLLEAAGRVHCALTFEPALPDGTLAGARKGSGNFSAVVRGRAAHAGRNPEDGRNALVAAADLALALARLALPGVSVNPARIEGGGPNNVVPELAVLRFNVRPADHAAQQAAAAAIAAQVDRVAAEHGVTIALHGHFARPPKPMDARQQGLFELVRDCGADLGLRIGWRDTGGVCDGNNLAAAGLPVVDTMGVRGGAIHSAEEFLCTDSLTERAGLAALVLMRLAQGAPLPRP